MIHITAHAVSRWIERVNPQASQEDATAAIHSHDEAIRKAADFGANTLRLGCGARLILDHLTVITVLPRRGY